MKLTKFNTARFPIAVRAPGYAERVEIVRSPIPDDANLMVALRRKEEADADEARALEIGGLARDVRGRPLSGWTVTAEPERFVRQRVARPWRFPPGTPSIRLELTNGEHVLIDLELDLGWDRDRLRQRRWRSLEEVAAKLHFTSTPVPKLTASLREALEYGLRRASVVLLGTSLETDKHGRLHVELAPGAVGVCERDQVSIHPGASVPVGSEIAVVVRRWSHDEIVLSRTEALRRLQTERERVFEAPIQSSKSHMALVRLGATELGYLYRKNGDPALPKAGTLATLSIQRLEKEHTGTLKIILAPASGPATPFEWGARLTDLALIGEGPAGSDGVYASGTAVQGR